MTDIVHEPPSLQSSRPSVNSTLAPGIVTSPPPGKINKTEKQSIDEKQPASSGNDAPVTNGMDDHPKALEAGVAGVESSDVIIVTWDGPDDVLNPKKYVHHVLSLIFILLYFLAGPRRKSGLRQR